MSFHFFPFPSLLWPLALAHNPKADSPALASQSDMVREKVIEYPLAGYDEKAMLAMLLLLRLVRLLLLDSLGRKGKGGNFCQLDSSFKKNLIIYQLTSTPYPASGN